MNESALPPLRIRLLGPVRVTLGGQDIAARLSRRETALLAYLACRPGGQPREHLADLLWDDRPLKQAQSNLRTLLTRLRKRIGAHLKATRQDVTLSPDAPWSVDIADFQALVQGARAHEGRLAVAQLERALRIVRDGFMAAFHLEDASQFETWSRENARRLRDVALEARVALARGSEECGDLDRSVEVTRVLVEMDPLDESSRTQLMRRFALAGNRAAAVETFHEGKALLREQLDVEPGAAMLSVFEAIQRGELTRGAEPESQRARHNLPPDPTPLIGRKPELRKLRQCLHEPGHRLITVTGPGGSGKSRLAIAAAREAAALFRDGVRYVFLDGKDIPAAVWDVDDKEFLLVLDGIDGGAVDVDALTALLSRTRQAVVLVTSRRRLGLGAEHVIPLAGLPVPPPDAAPEAGGTFDSIRLFVGAVERCGTTVPVDAETLPTIAAICDSLAGLPLGIELAAANAATIGLVGVAAIARDRPQELAATQVDATERHRSLAAVFASTWEGLSATEQKTLSACGLFGGSFTAEAAAVVCDAPTATLTALVAASALEAEADRFTLPRPFRALARGHMTEGTQARSAHAAYYLGHLAASYRQLVGPRPSGAIIDIRRNFADVKAAWHWAIRDASHDLLTPAAPALAEYIDIDGRWAEGQLLFRRAFEAVRARSDARVLRLLLACGRGRCLYKLGQGAEAAVLMQQEVADAGADVDETARVSALVTWGTALYSEWEAAIARAVLEEAATDAAAARLQRDEARARLALAYVALREHQADEMRRHVERALALSVEERDRRLEANALNALAAVSRLAGDRSAARDALQRALAIVRQIPDRLTECSILMSLTDHCRRSGDLDAATEHAADALELAEGLGQPTATLHALHTLAALAAATGRLSEARDHTERALALSSDGGNRHIRLYLQVARAENSLRIGEHAEAMRALRMILPDVRQCGDQRLLRWLLWTCGESTLARAEPDEALSYLEEAAAMPDPDPDAAVRSAGLRGRAQAGRGHPDAAARMFEQALEVATCNQLPPPIDAMLGLARLEVAHAPQSARTRVDSVLGLEEDSLDARQLWSCSRLLHAAGDERADKLLARAHARLLVEAGRIADPHMRASYLRNVSAHRELREAWARRATPAS